MSKGYKDLLLKEVKELLKKLPPNVRIRVYYDDMGKSKYTLNQLGSRIDQISDALFEFIKITNKNFEHVNNRIDNLTSDVNSLKRDVKNINARLDYYGLQIEGIQKRLDYNGLKKLPESNK